MIKSPLLEEFAARRMQAMISEVLEVRFGTVPADIGARLRTVVKERKLKAVVRQAATCQDLEAFRAFLQTR